MPENKTRKKYPGNFLRKNLRKKSGEKNPDFGARKIWPEILRRKQSPEKSPEIHSRKIQAKIKPFFRGHIRPGIQGSKIGPYGRGL